MESAVITLIVFLSVNQQDRRKTYKIKAFCVSIFALEMQYVCRITYYEWVFLAQVIQTPIRKHHVIICGLPGPTMLFHIISQTAWFLKEGVEYKMSVLIFCTNFP
jgi:hypothetical protein